MARKVNFSKGFKNKLNERKGQVEIKFGFIDATSIELSDDQIQAIIEGIEQMESFDKYYEIPANEELGIPDNFVACIVHTLTEEEVAANQNNEAQLNSKTGNVRWTVKCEAAPNNSLGAWMTQEQYGQTAWDSTYLFIGILQIQWFKYVIDALGNIVLEKKGNAEVKKKQFFKEKPEGDSYEIHSINLTELIDV